LLAPYISSFSLTNTNRKTCDVLLAEIDKEHELLEPNLVLLQLLFSTLLVKLSTVRPKLFDKHLSESRATTFIYFISLLEHNYSNIRDAKVYAEMLNITYKSLNQICKLAIEEIRVQQLADELGFNETTNFVKYFKKTPKVNLLPFLDLN